MQTFLFWKWIVLLLEFRLVCPWNNNMFVEKHDKKFVISCKHFKIENERYDWFGCYFLFCCFHFFYSVEENPLTFFRLMKFDTMKNTFDTVIWWNHARTCHSNNLEIVLHDEMAIALPTYRAKHKCLPINFDPLYKSSKTFCWLQKFHRSIAPHPILLMVN